MRPVVTMPKYEKLGIEHKDLLHERLRRMRTQVSEYSFPNLYLFRTAHNYEVVFDREVFIRGTTYDGLTYLMPTIPLTEMDCGYVQEMMETVDCLFPIPQDWLSCFHGDGFEFSSKKGEMDYIYTVEKISTFKGRHLHQKRNQLKQFMSSYSHQALPLTVEHREKALFITHQWQAETAELPADTDYAPCLEALAMSEELHLCGVIYYAEGEPAGFILGEELTPETFVLHFAKAQKKFRGIYQYMFNSFARILPAQYTYLNFEQDLDKKALRIAKSSYLPDYMLGKVRVSLKKR